MKCMHCGFESVDGFKFCPGCAAQAVSDNLVADRVLKLFKEKLFLALCILMSVSCVFSFSADGIPIIDILITVFLWLAYSQGRKGYADEKHLRGISGSVYAYYVIMNVAAGIFFVCGIITSLAFALLKDNAELIDAVKLEIGELSSEYLETLPQELIGMIGWLIGLVVIFVGIILLVVNILGVRKIHRFVKSVYQGIINRSFDLVNPRAAKNWLIFFGVCSGLSALSSLATDFSTFLASGAETATIIIAVILINRYFITTEIIN